MSYGWPLALQRLTATSPTRLQFDGPHLESDFARAVDREAELSPSPPREWWNPLADNPGKVVSYLKHLKAVDGGEGVGVGVGERGGYVAAGAGDGGGGGRGGGEGGAGAGGVGAGGGRGGGGGGIWGGMGMGMGMGGDILETPADELRMGLSGLGPTHQARRQPFQGGGALSLEPGPEDTSVSEQGGGGGGQEGQAPGLLARTRLRTLGGEGLLGW